MEIRRTIWGAFGYIYEYRDSLAKALVVPITIIAAANIIFSNPEGNSFETGFMLGVPLFVSYFYFYFIVAINTHRIILLGPRSVPTWGIYIPGRRELYFFLYSIAIVFIASLPVFPFTFAVRLLAPTSGSPFASFFAMLLPIPILVGFLYFFARLSLVLPAIATDQGWSIRDSWSATKDHQFSMIVVIGIFPFILGIPSMLLEFLAELPDPGAALNLLPYLKGVAAIVSSLTMVVTIAALSVAFHIISRERQDVVNST